MVPTVSCDPMGPGCDSISTSSGGAVGVKGLKSVDSANSTTNIFKDVEPPDQGLCAGNGDVVETNNIGEILVFNTALQRVSSPISLDSVMGLTQRNWSSGGDPSCEYDPGNGGTGSSPRSSRRAPSRAVAHSSAASRPSPGGCYEGIAVSQGSNPQGPYNVYYLNANYNSSEPGYPSC